MAADCEQTRGRMLELLYGELAAGARAEVDAHVAGCPACKAELRALEATRGLARQALAADAPPARARAAILQAAAAAVPARKGAAAVARPSWWDRLRGRWTLPTFATIGAVAVFLLASRIFLEPEKTYQRGRQGLGAPSTPAPQAAPAAAAQGPKNATAGLERADRAAKDEVTQPAGGAGAGTRPARRRSQPTAAAVPSAPRRPAKRSLDDMLEGAAPAAAAPAVAPPPPGRARDEREQRPPEREVDDDLLRAEDSPASGGRAAGSAAAAKRAPAPAGEISAAPAAAPARAARETPAARADRLFAQRRWTEAAVAYRELLRDEPRSPEAVRWRQRLAACEAAAPANPPPR